MLAYFIGAGTMVGAASIAERLCRAPRAKSISLNIFASILQIGVTQLFGASIAPAVLWASGKLPTPHLHLSAHGWMFPLSLFAILAATDLADYFFHRLEHRLPWLWKMHAFHHSDGSMNATTAYRAFWLDRILQAVWFIPLGLLVKADGPVMLVFTAIYWVMAAFEHADLHIGLPCAPWLVVTPQFHRLHHSVYKEHYDSNFSAIFPLWDILFGTYVEPEGFPETGLLEGEPSGWKESLLFTLIAIAPGSSRPARSIASTPQSRQIPLS